MNLSLPEVAKALGGEVAGRQVLAPGPGHRSHDRSLAVLLVPKNPDGFVVHSHAGDDPIVCRDHVRTRLGMPPWKPNGHAAEPIARPLNRAPAAKEKVVAEHIYELADGTPFLKVQRTEPKSFRQQRWTGTAWEFGKPAGPKIPYKLPQMLDAEHGTVFLCEGEKDADRLASLGLVATTNSEGAGAWSDDLDGHFQGRNVVILEDNDKAGADRSKLVGERLKSIAAELRVLKLPRLPAGGDVSDWLDEGGTVEQLLALAAAAPLFGKEPIGLSAATLQTMTFAPIKYVVPGYIVEGLTMLAAKPKIGKSWLMMHTAIAVATGGFTLGNVKCEEGDVLYAALEDNNRRLQSRMTKLLGLREWPKRLSFITSMPKLKEGGVALIRDWIVRSKNPRLCIIDVLGKVRSTKGKEESNYEADYAAVAELKALADEYGVAIVFVHHVRKMEAEDPLDTVSGTTGLTGAVDTVLVLFRTSQGTTLYGRGRDIEEIEKAVDFNRATCTWHVLGDAGDVHRSDERKTIIEALKASKEPMGSREIADSTGLPYAALRKMLFRMAKAGDIKKASRGRYTWDIGTSDDAGADDEAGVGTDDDEPTTHMSQCPNGQKDEQKQGVDNDPTWDIDMGTCPKGPRGRH